MPQLLHLSVGQFWSLLHTVPQRCWTAVAHSNAVFTRFSPCLVSVYPLLACASWNALPNKDCLHPHPCLSVNVWGETTINEFGRAGGGGGYIFIYCVVCGFSSVISSRFSNNSFTFYKKINMTGLHLTSSGQNLDAWFQVQCGCVAFTNSIYSVTVFSIVALNWLIPIRKCSVD